MEEETRGRRRRRKRRHTSTAQGVDEIKYHQYATEQIGYGLLSQNEYDDNAEKRDL